MWLNQECLLQFSLNCAVLGMAAYCLDLYACVYGGVEGGFTVIVSRRVELRNIFFLKSNSFIW